MNFRFRKPLSALVCLFVMAPLLTVAGLVHGPTVYGAQVNSRSLTLSNNVPSAASTYVITFDVATAGTLGSVKAEFCENTALFEVSCIAPAGLDLTTAVLVSQSGTTGFAIHPSTDATTLVLSRTPAAATAGQVSFRLDGVTNANAEGSQYSRFSTHEADDATDLPVDRGSVAYALQSSFSVSAEVPPYFEMCVGVTITGTSCATAQGNFVGMGEFSTARASTGQTQIVAATNAANGYTVVVGGRAMASGNNVLPALDTPTTSRPGTSQFGINVRNNTNPDAGQDPDGPGVGTAFGNYGQPNRFMFRSGDTIASYDDVDDYRRYTVTYLVNISPEQPAGIYNSTFTYIGLGKF